MVAGPARRSRVESRLSIHDEIVVVMTVRKGELECPLSIRHVLHRSRRAMPVVKIPGDAYGSGSGGVTKKANEVRGLLDRAGGPTPHRVDFRESSQPVGPSSHWVMGFAGMHRR